LLAFASLFVMAFGVLAKMLWERWQQFNARRDALADSPDAEADGEVDC